jgi:hypothetical protein
MTHLNRTEYFRASDHRPWFWKALRDDGAVGVYQPFNDGLEEQRGSSQRRVMMDGKDARALEH